MRILAFIAAFLMAFSPVWAASSRKVPVNAHISTLKTSGGDYNGNTGLATWEDATDGDQSSTPEVLDVYEGTYAISATNLLGATGLDATHFRVVRGRPGFTSRPIFTTNNLYFTIWLRENYVSIQDVTIIHTGTDGGVPAYISCIRSSVEGASVIGCDIGPMPNATAAAYGIYHSLAGNLLIENCYIHTIPVTATTRIGVLSELAATVYNCTIDGTGTGLYDNGTGVITATNTIIRNVATTTAGTVNATTCLFTTGAGLVDFDATMPNLDPADTAALGNVTDLSIYFTDDYNGDTRPTAWSIGADDIAATPPAASGGAQVFFFQ